MKGEDIKLLYQVSSEAHKSIEHTLRQLGDTSGEHYKRRRKVQRLMVAFAVIALSIVLSTAAYATKLFGLLAEPVGKYGLDLQIVQATADSAQIQVAPTEKKYATDENKTGYHSILLGAVYNKGDQLDFTYS